MRKRDRQAGLRSEKRNADHSVGWVRGVGRARNVMQVAFVGHETLTKSRENRNAFLAAFRNLVRQGYLACDRAATIGIVSATLRRVSLRQERRNAPLDGPPHLDCSGCKPGHRLSVCGLSKLQVHRCNGLRKSGRDPRSRTDARSTLADYAAFFFFLPVFLAFGG